MPTVVLPFLFAEEFGLDQVRVIMANAARQLEPADADGSA